MIYRWKLENYFYFLTGSAAFGVGAGVPGTALAGVGAGEALGAAIGGGVPILSFVTTLRSIMLRVIKKLVTKNPMAQKEVVFVRKFPAPLLPKML